MNKVTLIFITFFGVWFFVANTYSANIKAGTNEWKTLLLPNNIEVSTDKPSPYHHMTKDKNGNLYIVSATPCTIKLQDHETEALEIALYMYNETNKEWKYQSIGKTYQSSGLNLENFKAKITVNEINGATEAGIIVYKNMFADFYKIKINSEEYPIFDPTDVICRLNDLNFLITTINDIYISYNYTQKRYQLLYNYIKLDNMHIGFVYDTQDSSGEWNFSSPVDYQFTNYSVEKDSNTGEFRLLLRLEVPGGQRLYYIEENSNGWELVNTLNDITSGEFKTNIVGCNQPSGTEFIFNKLFGDELIYEMRITKDELWKSIRGSARASAGIISATYIIDDYITLYLNDVDQKLFIGGPNAFLFHNNISVKPENKNICFKSNNNSLYISCIVEEGANYKLAVSSCAKNYSQCSALKNNEIKSDNWILWK
jgi:hypothetical protein